MPAFMTTSLLFCLTSLTMAQEAVVALPDNPEAVVIRLDYLSARTPLTLSGGPFLEIRAGGRMTVRDRYLPNGSGTREGRLTGKELQELLRFILDEQRFHAGIGAEIERAIAAHEAQHGELDWILGGADTVIEVDVPGRKARLKRYALGFFDEEISKIAPLKRAYAVARRLHRLASLVRAGGAKGLAPALEAVNAELLRKHPAQKALTSSHLRDVRLLREGGHRLAFDRGELSVSAVVVDGKTTRISIRGL